MKEIKFKLPLAREEDHEFFQRELASFIPDSVFDAHVHLGRHECAPALAPHGDADYDAYRCIAEDLHPGRRSAALFLPVFDPARGVKIAEANEWVARQVSLDPRCRGELFVRPDDDPEWVRQQVQRLKLHGLKCYHLFSRSQPTWESQIPDYLPEPIVKVADDLGLVITLHMVRARAVADEGNIRWIRHYCRNYPSMKLILAHSARGFQPSHNLEGLRELAGLENLYFDTSANCESMAHAAIIRIFGHDRLLYGSDYPISHARGRSIAAADSFLWLYEESPVWGEKHMAIKPVLIGLEHLRSLKWACWALKLTDSQVEDIFWNNAARLLNV